MRHVRHEAHCYIARSAGRDERRLSLDLMANRSPKGCHAAKLIRWIKKFAKKCEVEWDHEYVSPRAAFQLAADELHLRRNPPGSRI
jgi:hypothetical protein